MGRTWKLTRRWWEVHTLAFLHTCKQHHCERLTHWDSFVSVLHTAVIFTSMYWRENQIRLMFSYFDEIDVCERSLEIRGQPFCHIEHCRPGLYHSGSLLATVSMEHWTYSTFQNKSLDVFTGFWWPALIWTSSPYHGNVLLLFPSGKVKLHRMIQSRVVRFACASLYLYNVHVSHIWSLKPGFVTVTSHQNATIRKEILVPTFT